MTEFKKLTDEELEKITGGINWACYGACLLSRGASAKPELAELVAAIVAKDWIRVSILTKQAAIASQPIVAECLACC